MNLVNSVSLIGRIVNEELNANPVSKNSNIVVCYLKIATNKPYLDKQSNEWKEKTQFIPLKSFGKQASYIANHFAKGDLIAINGELEVNTIEKKGEYVTYWSVIISNIKKLGKSSKNNNLSKTEEITINHLENSNTQSIDVELAEENSNSKDTPWELDF